MQQSTEPLALFGKGVDAQKVSYNYIMLNPFESATLVTTEPLALYGKGVVTV